MCSKYSFLRKSFIPFKAHVVLTKKPVNSFAMCAQNIKDSFVHRPLHIHINSSNLNVQMDTCVRITSDFDELKVKIRYQVMFGHVICT